MKNAAEVKITVGRVEKFRREREMLGRERELLVARLAQLFGEARLIEEALDIETRIKDASDTEPRVDTEVVGAPPHLATGAAEFVEPRGAISRGIWEHLIEHPGQRAGDLRKALKLDESQFGTAMHALVHKKGQVVVRGERGNFRYYAVTARPASAPDGATNGAATASASDE